MRKEEFRINPDLYKGLETGGWLSSISRLEQNIVTLAIGVAGVVLCAQAGATWHAYPAVAFLTFAAQVFQKTSEKEESGSDKSLESKASSNRPGPS